ERHARRYLWGMVIGWGVAVLFGICLTWKSMEATVVVHVVEVEAGTGVVRQVSPADVPYVPTDAAIARQVREVLLATRGLSTDPVMIHRQWDWAFSVVTQRGGQLLAAYGQERGFQKDIGKKATSIEITRTLRAHADHGGCHLARDHHRCRRASGQPGAVVGALYHRPAPAHE